MFVRELTRQVEMALDAGVPVSHLDSHQHIHTLPGMFPVLKRVQRRFGIRKVRSTINLLPNGRRMTLLRTAKKTVFRMALRHIYSTDSPAGLGDFRDFQHLLIQGKLPRLQSLELMVHPGTINQAYEDEVALLTSGWQNHLPDNAKLGSYHDL